MRGEPPPDLHAGLAAWPTTTGIRVATAARVTALIRTTCRARIGATPHGRWSASDRGRARSARTPKAWWSPCSPTVRIPNLGLHGMAKGFKALEQATEVHALEHAEWLGLLLEHEVTLRRQKRFEARARTARLRHNASVEDIDYHAARGLDRALFLIRPFIETGAAGLRSAKTSRAITSANALMLNDSSSARRTGFDSRLPRVLVLGHAEAMAGFPRRTQRKAPRP